MSIVNNSPVEDRYIAYLAGLPRGGQQTIEFMDKYQASSAQRHPISNQISSSIVGSIKGITLTALGVLAYPVVNEGIKSDVLGSTWEVCSTWVDNFQTHAESLYNFDPHKISDYVDFQKVKTVFWQMMKTSHDGLKTGYKCLTDDAMFEQCREELIKKGRANDYINSVMDTASTHRMLIGAVTVGLVALCTASKMSSYTMQELQTEKNLRNTLANRFGKIATRLTTLETNRDAQECARRILQNRLQINKEIENLHLPSLTWKDIEQITQPVFDAALRIQPKKF